MITFLCDHCRARISVADTYAGRRGKCPKCKGAIQVPPAPSGSDGEEGATPDTPTGDAGLNVDALQALAQAEHTADALEETAPRSEEPRVRRAPLWVGGGVLGLAALVLLFFLTRGSSPTTSPPAPPSQSDRPAAPPSPDVTVAVGTGDQPSTPKSPPPAPTPPAPPAPISPKPDPAEPATAASRPATPSPQDPPPPPRPAPDPGRPVKTVCLLPCLWVCGNAKDPDRSQADFRASHEEAVAIATKMLTAAGLRVKEGPGPADVAVQIVSVSTEFTYVQFTDDKLVTRVGLRGKIICTHDGKITEGYYKGESIPIAGETGRRDGTHLEALVRSGFIPCLARVLEQALDISVYRTLPAMLADSKHLLMACRGLIDAKAPNYLPVFHRVFPEWGPCPVRVVSERPATSPRGAFSVTYLAARQAVWQIKDRLNREKPSVPRARKQCAEQFLAWLGLSSNGKDVPDLAGLAPKAEARHVRASAPLTKEQTRHTMQKFLWIARVLEASDKWTPAHCRWRDMKRVILQLCLDSCHVTGMPGLVELTAVFVAASQAKTAGLPIDEAALRTAANEYIRRQTHPTPMKRVLDEKLYLEPRPGPLRGPKDESTDELRKIQVLCWRLAIGAQAAPAATDDGVALLRERGIYDPKKLADLGRQVQEFKAKHHEEFQQDAVQSGALDAIHRIASRPIEEEEVRYWLFRILGVIGHPSSIDVLHQWVGRDHRALTALAAIKHPRAVPILLQGLASKYNFTRNTAFQLLVGIRDEPRLAVLAEVCQNEKASSRSRAVAACALSSRKDPRALPVLVASLREAPQLHSRGKPNPHVVRGIARYGEKGIALLLDERDRTPYAQGEFQAVLDELGWKPANTKEKAQRLLALREWREVVALGDGAIGALLGELRRKDLRGLPDAIGMLVQVGTPRATKAVRGLARHDDPRVRVAVCKGLAEEGRKSRESAQILSLLVKDKESEVRRGAITALGQIRDDGAVSVLMEAAERHESPACRQMALCQLANLAAPKAKKILIKALEPPNPTYIRGPAARALRRMGWRPTTIEQKTCLLVLDESRNTSEDLVRLGRPAIPALLAFLNAKDLMGHQMEGIITALGQLKAIQAVAPLLKKLDEFRAARSSVDQRLAVNVMQALGMIGDHRATSKLAEVMESDRKRGIHAAKALGLLGDPKAVDPLIRVVRDAKQTSWTRNEALQSLAKLGGDKAKGLLRELASDPQKTGLPGLARILLGKVETPRPKPAPPPATPIRRPKR